MATPVIGLTTYREEAGAWAEEHDRLVPVLGDTARFWRERARGTEVQLRRLLSTDFRAA